MEYSFHYEFNLIKFLMWVLIFWALYWFFKNCVRVTVSTGANVDMSEDEDLPHIMLIGNENYSISGLTYQGMRIPDVEIKSKALYVDGVFKRKLARNSRVYNRGAGIFVDGKYVG